MTEKKETKKESKKKTKDKKSEEESKLEEEVKEKSEEEKPKNLEISESNFEEFLKSQKVNAPVLNQIEVSNELKITNLESNLSKNNSLDKKSDEEFNYISKIQDGSEKIKYLQYESGFSKLSRKENLTFQDDFERRRIEFKPSENRGPESRNYESHIEPKNLDEKELLNQNKDPFKGKEIKYKPSEY